MRRRLLVLLLVAVALAAGAFFFVVPATVERYVNRTRQRAPGEPTERARALHARLLIADLHADSLLWDRDLLARSTRGHVDAPRLAAGNVALQLFTAVTKVPFRSNYERNDARTDEVTPLVIAERWPVAAWTSLRERALYQARKLQEAAARSGGQLVIIRSAPELAAFLARREREPQLVAGLLGIEGAHALEGDLANLDRFSDAGFRLIGLAHFFDNEWAGSAHGVEKTGLTERGRELVRRMQERRIIVDLAHASARTIDDVLAQATRPVIVSHTGVRGTCPNARNLSDEQLRGVAATGGLIGIGYWEAATCGTDARAAARAVRYAAGVVGVEHVALGSDFDGAVAEPFDASDLVALTDALLAEGFSEDEVRMIEGENVLRFLAENLPQ